MNPFVILFICYCGLSILWSDYPDVAFKRWFKALGDLVMVMIVLSDPEPSAAVKRFLARATFLIVPVSVLMVKYYPELGYRCWATTGKCQIVGLATDKNMLGVICLVSGVSAVWRLLHVDRKTQSQQLIAQGVILAMVLWLFWKAYSVTSISCFMIATTLLVLTAVPALARKQTLVHLTVLALLSVSFSVLFLNIAASLLESVGKDPTLSDRTLLWPVLYSAVPNSLFGAGFESFWLGPRLLKIWSFFGFQPNEAHNGYFEVFLNLGGVGLALLVLALITGYRNAIAMLRWDTAGGGFRLAVVVVALAYSFTEAGFRMLSPVWICFLLAAIGIPKRDISRSSRGRDTLTEPIVIPSRIGQWWRYEV